jgi:hypothetical protein
MRTGAIGFTSDIYNLPDHWRFLLLPTLQSRFRVSRAGEASQTTHVCFAAAAHWQKRSFDTQFREP